MASSWDSYYVVFLAAILALIIPSCIGMLSFFFLPRPKKYSESSSLRTPLRTKQPAFESVTNQTVLGQRINVRFFLAANAALILITLVLALIPCVTTLESNSQDGILKGILAIVTIAGFAVLGLLYSVRKGDMGWISSYHSQGVGHGVKGKRSS